MHITFYKTGKISIPPPLYGGAQRVIYWLGKALIKLGHRVTLISNPGNFIPGADVRPVSTGRRGSQEWVGLVPGSTDILHLWDMPTVPGQFPALVTYEGYGRPGQGFHRNTVFVSRRHAANHGSAHFVYNGLDPAEYACSEKREDYAVFLAKARWVVKNFPGAVAVARRARVELRVLGSRNWPFNLQRLFPAIRGVRYYGMLGGQEKRDLLSRARCLIFPVRWHEPFGIALTEALVSGCYVAATPYGSMPEIVTSDVGVLSSRVSDLAEAVCHPEPFTPGICRRRVLEGGFTHLDMAKKYVVYYERILTQGRLGDCDEPAPRTAPGFIANQLLDWSD